MVFINLKFQNLNMQILFFYFVLFVVVYTFLFIIRIELSNTGNVILQGNYQLYNLTIHGLFMVLFVVMPILIGCFGNFFFPLPRMNNLSFWFLPPSLFLLVTSLVIETSVDTGWTVYISSAVYFAIFSLHLDGISSLFSFSSLLKKLITFLGDPNFRKVLIYKLYNIKRDNFDIPSKNKQKTKNPHVKS